MVWHTMLFLTKIARTRADALWSFAIMPALTIFFLYSPLSAQNHLTKMIEIRGACVRVTGGIGRSGAAFMTISNLTMTNDRILKAHSEIAKRTEVHTYEHDDDGVMRMVHLTDGLLILGQQQHMLARGGDHIMLMGLTRTLNQGDKFPLTLVFENAGEITLDIMVDNEC